MFSFQRVCVRARTIVCWSFQCVAKDQMLSFFFLFCYLRGPLYFPLLMFVFCKWMLSVFLCFVALSSLSSFAVSRRSLCATLSWLRSFSLSCVGCLLNEAWWVIVLFPSPPRKCFDFDVLIKHYKYPLFAKNTRRRCFVYACLRHFFFYFFFLIKRSCISFNSSVCTKSDRAFLVVFFLASFLS